MSYWIIPDTSGIELPYPPEKQESLAAGVMVIVLPTLCLAISYGGLGGIALLGILVVAMAIHRHTTKQHTIILREGRWVKIWEAGIWCLAIAGLVIGYSPVHPIEPQILRDALGTVIKVFGLLFLIPVAIYCRVIWRLGLISN